MWHVPSCCFANGRGKIKDSPGNQKLLSNSVKKFLISLLNQLSSDITNPEAKTAFCLMYIICTQWEIA